MSRRDDLVGELIGGLTDMDRARFARGITLGALVGAALAGSVIRARRARRRPRPVLRIDPAPGADAAPPGSADPTLAATDPTGGPAAPEGGAGPAGPAAPA